MNREEWDAFIGTLSKTWREIAQAFMRRVNHILSADRNERLGDIQRIDRHLARLDKRVGELEGRERNGASG